MKSRPIHIRVGELDALKLGARRFDLRDPYYLVLTLSWPAFFALAVVFYLFVNLCFACAYFAVPGAVAGVRPGVFLDTYFFSIETLATVGYGVMSPTTLYGHVVASTEIIFGMMSMAVITGLVFTRFSRPRGRLLFSRVAVVGSFDGSRALMMRVVNERHQMLADASARLTMLRGIHVTEGKTQRRFVDLKLERASTPMLGLSWTLVHIIDEQSPLFGTTEDDLVSQSTGFMASINGYDESISANIVARQTYNPATVHFDHQFVDVIKWLPDGQIILDLTRFHDVEPITRDGN